VNDRTALDRGPEPQGGFPAEPPPPETGATGRPGFVCRVCVPWFVRRRRVVIALAALAWVAGTFFSAKLYANLHSGFEELLPDTAPSVIAARTLGPKLHTVTHLSIIFEGNDGDGLDRLADDLAARLRKLPPDLVERVEYRTDEQERFLRRFGGLYLTTDDLQTIQSRIEIGRAHV